MLTFSFICANCNTTRNCEKRKLWVLTTELNVRHSNLDRDTISVTMNLATGNKYVQENETNKSDIKYDHERSKYILDLVQFAR